MPSMAKPGPKPMKRSEKRIAVISIRCTLAQQRAFQKRAKELGISLNEWLIRQAEKDIQ